MNYEDDVSVPQGEHDVAPPYHWKVNVDEGDWSLPGCVLRSDGVYELEQPISAPLPELAIVWADLLEEAQEQTDWPIITFDDDAVFRYEGVVWPWAEEVLVIAPQSLLGRLGRPLLQEIQTEYRAEGAFCSYLVKYDLDGGYWGQRSYLQHDNIFRDEDDEASALAAWKAEAAASALAREWPEPVPFGTHDAELFPLQALSDWQADFASALAETGQYTETGVAPMLLGVDAACLQGRVEVQPKPDPSYREPVNLYVLVASASSAGKSPVLGTLGVPLELAQERMKAAAAVKREAATAEFVRVEKEIAKVSDALASGEDCEAELAKLVQRRRELDGVRMCQGRFITQEPTQEALARLLAAEGSILFLQDEVHLPTLTGTRWGGKPNLTLLLQSYSGTSFTSDRVMSGELYIPRPLLTIVGGIQPGVVGQFLGTEEVVSRGLAGRTFIVFGGDRFGSRTYETDVVPEALLRRYHRMVERLTALPSHRSTPPRLLFSGDAFAVQSAFFDEIDRELANNRDNDFVSFLGKIVGGAARIAAILHSVEHAKHNAGIGLPISGETMQSAIEIARFFKGHAQIAYSEIDNREDLQIIVWERIAREGLGEFSANDLFARMKGSRFVKFAADLRGPLDGLVRRNFLVPLPEDERAGRAGRKPSKRYRVNPRAVALGQKD